VNGQVAQDAHGTQRHGTDHPRQRAVRRLGDRPPGVARAAQQIESPRVRRPAHDAPEIPDPPQVRLIQRPDQDAGLGIPASLGQNANSNMTFSIYVYFGLECQQGYPR
jgi:hypothetical protein